MNRILGHPIVMITWIDSSSLYGWNPLEAKMDLKATSIGIVIHSDKERVVLTTTLAHDTMTPHSQIHIPRKAISKMRYL